jgi:hypothetical protein
MSKPYKPSIALKKRKEKKKRTTVLRDTKPPSLWGCDAGRKIGHEPFKQTVKCNAKPTRLIHKPLCYAAQRMKFLQ